MSTDPQMGRLDPAVEAELKRIIAEHHMDRAQLNGMLREIDELVSPPEETPLDD